MKVHPGTFAIQGREITLPVEVRDADSWAAQFLVPARAAQRFVEPTGLEVAQPMPGRAICNLAFVNYRDSDLDSYHEVAIAFLVRPHGVRGGTARQKMREFFGREIGVYIHHLPVNQTFTLQAGRDIWGYPKFLADIDITYGDDHVMCTLVHDGMHILTLGVRERGPIKLPQQNLPTFSFLDDQLRRTEWDQRAQMLGRLGGAKLELGTHPVADELRSLGLPKRAVMCSTMRDMQATFGPATAI